MFNFNNIRTLNLLVNCCPIDILFEIRCNSTISLNIISQLKTVSQNNLKGTTSTNSFHTYKKNKIIHNIKDIVTKSFKNKDLTLISRGYPNCFNSDSINGTSMDFINPRYVHKKNNIVIRHKDQNSTLNLTFRDVGLATHFNMITSGANNIVVKNDSIIINFELAVNGKVGREIYSTLLCFKECINDDVVFVGSKKRYIYNEYTDHNNYVPRETFALIYDRNSNGNGFSYIILDPKISGIFSISLIGSVFIHKNQKILCIRDQTCVEDAGPATYIHNVNIYIYNVNSRALMSRITINECYNEHVPLLRDVSLAFIANRLVYVKNDKYLITITWINVEHWQVEETVNIPLQKDDNNAISIKLIGVHDNSSIMILINRNRTPLPRGVEYVYYLENVYYF